MILVARSRRGLERARAFSPSPDALEILVEPDIRILVSRSAECHFDPAGLALFGTVDAAVSAGQGCALGRLRSLVASRWGSYLAFSWDAKARIAMVDPSGAGQSHFVRDPHLTLIGNRLSPDLMRNCGFRISADHAALAGCLLDPGTMVAAPLLAGVTTMVPGSAYYLGSDRAPDVLWSPAAIETDSERRPATLRTAVDSAVSIMTCRQQSLLELSGGLDSSILAGTMRDVGVPAKAVAVQLIGGDVCEGRYAAATSAFSRIPLQIATTENYPDYASFMEAPQVAHPFMYGVDDAFADAVRSAIDEHSHCVVTGQGGDAVFYQPATPLTTIDRFRDRGWRSGWNALLDDARRTRSSIWHHLGPVFADRFQHAKPPQDELAGGLLTSQARNERLRFVHPWCDAARDLSPGRQLQILMLANSQIFHSPRAVDVGRPMLHPLLSQPVVESALAFPSWKLAQGPNDRGLARLVFADRLHPDIVERRSKGEAAAFYSRTALANLPYLRERLLDGALVRAGIADRDVMARALTPEYLFYSLDYRALILHAACEAWLEAWS